MLTTPVFEDNIVKFLEVGLNDCSTKEDLSETIKEAKIIEGVADSIAATKYAITYQRDSDFYELWKTFDVLPAALGAKSVFWLSTQNYPNSNIFGVRPEILK